MPDRFPGSDAYNRFGTDYALKVNNIWEIFLYNRLKLMTVTFIFSYLDPIKHYPFHDSLTTISNPVSNLISFEKKISFCLEFCIKFKTRS